MTRRLTTLAEVADRFDCVVLDQWGVLHDGTAPYPRAASCLRELRVAGHRLAVLSNSGKRAAPNADRIAAMGFDPTLFEVVMSSGEALWQDIAQDLVPERAFFAIERAAGDAARWAKGLDVTLVDALDSAEAVLLMGLPDQATEMDFSGTFKDVRAAGLPVICTNPDRASPRADGQIVLSSGALAHAHADQGGDVRFYGKPHLPVFRALEAFLCAAPDRLLMVGDSLEHDIAGAHGAGWSTCFVEGGLHAADFSAPPSGDALTRIAEASAAPIPDYTLATLQ